jgi:diguanylate cyclase (GGDEF)-like protein
MRKISIKTKLSLGLSLLLIATFLAINLINYYVSKGSIRSNIIHDALPVISSNIYSEIQKDLITPVNVSSLMANDTFLKDWVLEGEKGPNKVIRYLKEIQLKYGFFSTFFVSERTGLYYHFKGIHKKISADNVHDVWYYNFKKMGVDFDLEVDTNEAANGALTIFINHRLTDYDGNFIGVTGVGLNMARVGTLLAEYRNKYHKNVYLVDGSGLIQVHRNNALIHKAKLTEIEGLKTGARQILDSKKTPLVMEFDRKGEHIILLSRYIPEFGWYLIVEQVESAVLADIRANLVRNLIIGLMVTLFVILINLLLVNHFQGRLEALATTDELTQVNNRRHFLELAQREVAMAKRTNQDFALIMMDADHFKSINDQHGHLVGDQVLQALAKTIAGGLREYDVLGRWGGEEFAAVLPSTNLEKATAVAERIRRLVENLELPSSARGGRLTLSLGIAVGERGNLSLEAMTPRFTRQRRRAAIEFARLLQEIPSAFFEAFGFCLLFNPPIDN